MSIYDGKYRQFTNNNSQVQIYIFPLYAIFYATKISLSIVTNNCNLPESNRFDQVTTNYRRNLEVNSVTQEL